jgi:Pin2-interacting protein X1
MASQGWTPGSFLGARNASHADSFTAASASHIRVTLKDDTLGLGARTKGQDEPTGLDAFQGLLGRLNGKSDSKLEEEQRKRDEIRLARYAQQKWQTVRFVSAGYLAQEKSDIFPEKNNITNDMTITENRSLRTDKEDLKADQNSSAADGKASSSEKSSEKNSEKKSKDKTKKKDRKKKEKRKASNDLTATETPAVVESSKSRDETVSHKATPSREQRPMGRHAIRGRHIQQKKKALMDDRSLNEVSGAFPFSFVFFRMLTSTKIFMIKT